MRVNGGQKLPVNREVSINGSRVACELAAAEGYAPAKRLTQHSLSYTFLNPTAW